MEMTVHGPFADPRVCVLLSRGAEVDTLLVDMGKEIARMHDGGLVHGDLTTSNMIVRQPDKQVVGVGLVRSGGGTLSDKTRQGAGLCTVRGERQALAGGEILPRL